MNAKVAENLQFYIGIPVADPLETLGLVRVDSLEVDGTPVYRFLRTKYMGKTVTEVPMHFTAWFCANVLSLYDEHGDEVLDIEYRKKIRADLIKLASTTVSPERLEKARKEFRMGRSVYSEAKGGAGVQAMGSLIILTALGVVKDGEEPEVDSIDPFEDVEF